MKSLQYKLAGAAIALSLGLSPALNAQDVTANKVNGVISGNGTSNRDPKVTAEAEAFMRNAGSSNAKVTEADIEKMRKESAALGSLLNTYSLEMKARIVISMANSFNAKKRDIEQAKKLLAEEPNNPDRLKNLTEKLVSAQLCLRSDWIILSGFPQETPNRNILLAKFREEAVKYGLKLPEDNIDKK